MVKRTMLLLLAIVLAAGCSQNAPETVKKTEPAVKEAAKPIKPKKSSEPKMDTLFSAAVNGQLATVMRMLDEGQDINQQDDEGNTALAWASLRGKSGVVKYLVEHNANPNLPNTKGLTPLHQACLFGDKTVVQTLIDFGADVNYEGPGKMKAVEIARKMKHQDIVDMLEKAASK